MKKKTVVVTRKKKLYDEETGDYIEMDYVETHDTEKDSNFHKIFLDSFISVLESTSEKAGKKLKVLCWILRKINRNSNMLYCTYRQIADSSHISYATVAAAMENLLEADFLRRAGAGKYMANPEVIFWGTYQRRCRAVSEYAKLGKTGRKMTAEKRLSTIQRNIARLEREAKLLQDSIDEQQQDSMQDAETDGPVMTEQKTSE